MTLIMNITDYPHTLIPARIRRRLGALLLFAAGSLAAPAQTTAFTYQGQLTADGQPAAGLYDLRFTVFAHPTAPTPGSDTLEFSAVAVSNGLFTVELDFGPEVFLGDPRWLEVEVRTNGGGGFTTLSPRTSVTSAPYAQQALRATEFFGMIHESQLPSNIPRLDGWSQVFTGPNSFAQVGVGTASPSETLHVVGRARFENAFGGFSTDGFHPLNNTVLMGTFYARSNSGPQLRFTGAGGGFIDIGQNGVGDFVVEANDTPRFLLRGTAPHFVGINTTNPTAQLTVAGPSGTALRLQGPGGLGSTLAVDFSTYDAGTNAPAARILATDGNWSSSLSLQTKIPGGATNELATRVFVSSGGAVGIGSTNPYMPLTIRGVGTGEFADLLGFQHHTGTNRWHLRIQSGGPGLYRIRGRG